MTRRIGIIGGGPAGLMAAEVLSAAGCAVRLFEAMPTVGRKLLMAGKSGLNIAHAEPDAAQMPRYGAAAERLAKTLAAFPAPAVRAWADGLGAETFVGSSGRIFPRAMKASPLLRAWLARLEGQGVSILTRHRWVGFGQGTDSTPALHFETPDGPRTEQFDAVILALGGASWPRLGSDAAWVPWLVGHGIPVRPFRPANCGFDVDWSQAIVDRFAGQPVKAVAATSAMGTSQGEFVITRRGIEGSLVYAHAAALRDALDETGAATLMLDLMAGRPEARIARDIEKAGAKASFANRLRKAGLDPVKVALLREFSTDAQRANPDALARCIKTLPLAVAGTRPIAEAISSAGGVAWEAVNDSLMLGALPGVFVAGEMLDWEAPTGGYLLTACLATGRRAGLGVADWLA
ncbi:TIGR03862 family flavoprotein [Pelagibacterium montanilacus]|uniref:TIGR03862 family flavoprotein n=1 Tax=Pelagibacterium montanilacus TaxID=2185280 RepID=UPI000F8DED9C|nr:TIGR03862 family flavoprotein [Pelagibacterium montanilacus]